MLLTFRTLSLKMFLKCSYFPYFLSILVQYCNKLHVLKSEKFIIFQMFVNFFNYISFLYSEVRSPPYFVFRISRFARNKNYRNLFKIIKLFAHNFYESSLVCIGAARYPSKFIECRSLKLSKRE